MAITRGAIKKRLERLAARKGLCPTHMAPLWCALETEWLGSEAEWDELGELIRHVEPETSQLAPSGALCSRCREPLYCMQCCQETLAKTPPREIDMSPDEFARYQRLIKLLHVTPGEHRDKDFFRHAPPAPKDTSYPWQRTPPAAPAPIPLPIPEPVVTIPSPRPAPVVDEDEQVDTEIAEILAQLQRRLPT